MNDDVGKETPVGSPRDDSGKAVDVALAEFNALRAEILHHTATKSALVGIGLTAVGVIVGLVVKDGSDERLLLAIPALAALVNLLAAAESQYCNLIGGYIEKKLWPYITARVDSGLPSWETKVSSLYSGLQIIPLALIGAPSIVLFPAASFAAMVVVKDVQNIDDGLLIGGWALTALAFFGPIIIGAIGKAARSSN